MPVHLYSGPPRSEGDVATLARALHTRHVTFPSAGVIDRIDGQNVKGLGGQAGSSGLALLPGRHTVEFTSPCAWSGGAHTEITLEFEAKAGHHRYLLQLDHRRLAVIRDYTGTERYVDPETVEVVSRVIRRASDPMASESEAEIGADAARRIEGALREAMAEGGKAVVLRATNGMYWGFAASKIETVEGGTVTLKRLTDVVTSFGAGSPPETVNALIHVLYEGRRGTRALVRWLIDNARGPGWECYSVMTEIESTDRGRLSVPRGFVARIFRLEELAGGFGGNLRGVTIDVSEVVDVRPEE
ncbi:MAG: hypothetical protein ACRELA_25285 [Candidatus Rokuibacteriota bacterium]